MVCDVLLSHLPADILPLLLLAGVVAAPATSRLTRLPLVAWVLIMLATWLELTIRTWLYSLTSILKLLFMKTIVIFCLPRLPSRPQTAQEEPTLKLCMGQVVTSIAGEVVTLWFISIPRIPLLERWSIGAPVSGAIILRLLTTCLVKLPGVPCLRNTDPFPEQSCSTTPLITLTPFIRFTFKWLLGIKSSCMFSLWTRRGAPVYRPLTPLARGPPHSIVLSLAPRRLVTILNSLCRLELVTLVTFRTLLVPVAKDILLNIKAFLWPE